MSHLQENTILLGSDLLLHHFVNDETIQNMIKEEVSISELSCLIRCLHEKIKRNLSTKFNFPVSKILENECPIEEKASVLKMALQIQADDAELIYCLCSFNTKLSSFDMEGTSEYSRDVLEIICLASTIIDITSPIMRDIFTYVDEFTLKKFLLKICGMELSENISIDISSLFFKYLEIMILKDSKFIDDAIQYFTAQENLNFLCMIFDNKLRDVAFSNYFQQDSLWDYLKKCIVSTNSVKKKQAQYILLRTLEFLKTNNDLIPEALKVQSFREWDIFFILLEMSKEKQLHLIAPTLRLLSFIRGLHISWQICLYQELLNHSQLNVVYNVVGYILNLKFTHDPIHQQLLHDIFVALNKFEYSFLSQKIFSNLNEFFIKLNDDCHSFVYEEFLNINWNPAAAWCVLRSASSILHKIPESFIIQMLRCLRNLPHMYIKTSCIIFFFEKLLNDIFNAPERVILIGKFLFSTNQQIDKEVFYHILETNKRELRTCSDKWKQLFMKYLKKENPENLMMSLEVMKKLELRIDYQVKELPSDLDDLILFYFPNLLQPNHIGNYVLKRFQNHDNFRYLWKFLELLFEENLVELSNDKLLYIWSASENSEQKLIASYLIYRTPDKSSVDSNLMREVELCLKHPEFDGYKLCKKEIKNTFDVMQENKQYNELFIEFSKLLDTDDEYVLMYIISNLDEFIEYMTVNPTEFVQVLNICLIKICSLPNNSMRSYSLVFFKSIFELNLFSNHSFAECWEKWYSELFPYHFMKCESLLKVILEGCRKIILLEAPYANILTPLILSALNKGMVIQKNQRVEYGICQEIHKIIGPFFIQNPNLISMEVRVLSIECLYLLAKNKSLKNISSPDDLMDMLLAQYMKSYNKRYFPDSEIHLEKLRIVQAMLIIVQFTKTSEQNLVEFILKSFCEESHQPSVRQLLQWLLIILVAGKPNYLNLMIEKIETSNLSNPSSIVAIVPVMYHLLTTLRDEECWCQVSTALLPWTMGANFKLRVYAQITLKNILRQAKHKQLTEFVHKYSFLLNSISTVLDATGSAASETLKNDLTFIETLDPDMHFSVENIFVLLPKMLEVPASEWENVLKHEFCDEFKVKIETEYKLPNIIFQKNTDFINDSETSCMNVQKKIIPWKENLQEKIDNKLLNSLICVASLVEKYSNIGGLSRTCEIFNVKQLVVHNIKIKDDKEFKSLSMSSENWVDLMEVKKNELSSFLIKLREEGYSIIGLEQTSQSVKLNEFEFKDKTVILLGNEKEGIPAPLLPLLDTCVEIPQFGQTRSLNVHVAGAIFIWEYIKQHLQNK